MDKNRSSPLSANTNEPQETEKTFHTSPTGGRKETKEARYSLIPVEALRALAEVYGRGAAKYEADNWRRGYDFGLSLDALQRHIESFREGIDTDAESGQHHLAHAAWHCFTLFVFSTNPRYKDYDDRNIERLGWPEFDPSSE